MRQTCILLPDSDLVYRAFFFFREDNEHCPKLALQRKYYTLHARHLAFKKESHKLTLSVTDQTQLQPLALHRHQYRRQKRSQQHSPRFSSEVSTLLQIQSASHLVNRAPSRSGERTGDVLRQKRLRNKSSKSKGVRQ